VVRAFALVIAVAAWITASFYIVSLAAFPVAALLLLLAPAVRYPCGVAGSSSSSRVITVSQSPSEDQ
jgi:hypothetical protein